MPDDPSSSDAKTVLARGLASCRYILLIAVIGCLIVAVSVLLFGAALVVKITADMLRGTEISVDAGKSLALTALEAIDLFLIGAVAYLTAAGLYTLFISSEVSTPTRLGIESLTDLEEKIIGVLVVALGVLFLGEAVSWSAGKDMLYSGAAVAVVIFALGYFIRRTIRHGGPE